MMSHPITKLCCALLLFTAVVADAQPVSDAASAVTEDTSPTGLTTTIFTERSPLSAVEAVAERFRMELKEAPEDYALADETFEVYVPAGYDGSEPFGLVVWIHAGENGAPPEPYLPVLDNHKLIWVGANHAGNDRLFLHRAGLALDARHNLMRRLRIDPMRVYVSGISGGGRCASRIGPTYADLFSGAFAMVGVDFFLQLPHPDSKGNLFKFWGASFNPPSPPILRRAKRDGRYVLLTGEHDDNRQWILTTYQYGYQRAGFEHVTCFDVPGMGHELPTAEWFEKGLAALDEPLEAIRARRESEAQHAFLAATDVLKRSPEHGLKALRRLLEDYPDTTYAPKAEAVITQSQTQPADVIDRAEAAEVAATMDKAREDLALARNYLQAGRPDLARGLLENIIHHFPDSEEADQAQSLLAERPTRSR